MWISNVLLLRNLHAIFTESPPLTLILVPPVLGVTAYAVDPGVVNTEITRHIRRPLVDIAKFFSRLIKTPAEGAYTAVYCAVTPENQMLNGGYYKSV